MININLYKKFFLTLAFYMFLVGCNQDDLSKVNNINLELSSGSIERLIDTPFIFKIEGDNGINITDQAEIIVNDKRLKSNVFTTSVTGTYRVQAIYQGIKSNVLDIKVVAPTKYVQRVLVEDYTGTWCGWCPRIAHAIDLTKKQSDKVVSVAVHSGNDPYVFKGSEDLVKTFGIKGLPKGIINRVHQWSSLKEHESLHEVLNKTGFSANLGLAIKSQVDNDNINIVVKVGFAKSYQEQLQLVLYLVENNVIGKQINYTDFFGGGKVIKTISTKTF